MSIVTLYTESRFRNQPRTQSTSSIILFLSLLYTSVALHTYPKLLTHNSIAGILTRNIDSILFYFFVGHVIENAIVQGPEIALGEGPVPDPHTTEAVGDQGLHTTDVGGLGPVPVLHVEVIETTGVVHDPDHDLPTRGGGIETERGDDRETERGRGRGREIAAEIGVGHQGGDQLPRVLTAHHPRSPSKYTSRLNHSSF